MNLTAKLLTWYQANKRDLPWRNTSNPYFIWLSEIILQQTRVDQGMAYYHKFVSKYPLIDDLAGASENDVLNDWQGLGYYSRARNLHETSKNIVNAYSGVFPDNYNELIKLKGIGKYSAAAISSFAFNEVRAVIDGNVFRVLSRLFAIDTPIDTTKGRKEFEDLAAELISKEKPGEFNQAIMEFGAIQCKPVNPNCHECIFSNSCIAFQNNNVSKYPVKSKKIKQRNRYFNYLVIKNMSGVYLKKRTGNDIWKNLYDFPLIEMDKKSSGFDIINSENWKQLFKNSDPIVQEVSENMTHQLSHQKIQAKFWEIILKDNYTIDNQYYTHVKFDDIDQYPVPKLIENYLNLKI